jgi:hypothetical protein
MDSENQPRITLKQLAEQILTLPPEQQAEEARYQVTDYDGEPVMFKIHGIITDRNGTVVIRGNDRRTYDNPQRGPV